MSALKRAEGLTRDGRFAEALRVLTEAPVYAKEQNATEALRAELLERVGRSRDARFCVERLLRARHVGPHERSRCHYILGRLAASEGNAQLAIEQFHKCISIAGREADHERIAWAQSRLLLILADISGPESVGALLSELRLNAVRTGSPTVLAAVHLFVSQMELQRGLVSVAAKHLSVAKNLLGAVANPWLESVGSHIQSVISILSSDFKTAISSAKRSAEASLVAGDSLTHAVAVCNLGHLLFLTGEFTEAFEQCRSALGMFVIGSDNYSGALDNLAQIRLAEGSIDEAREYVAELEHLAATRERNRYPYRYSLLTRAKLCLATGDDDRALDLLESAIRLSVGASDSWLLNAAQLSKADFLFGGTSPAQACAILYELGTTLLIKAPDIVALYERVLAKGLAHAGSHFYARDHFGRALRMYETLHHKVGHSETIRAWQEFCRAHSDADVPSEPPSAEPEANGVQVLHSLSAALMLAHRPELVAHELVELIRLCRCVRAAAVLRTGPNDEASVVSHFGELPASSFARLTLWKDSNGLFELVFVPKEDAVSIASTNALVQVVQSLRDLHEARVARDERLTLWPTEELPLNNADAVISGHMRELMTFAQRVARTTVSVLITGESGTGKEILARAIHEFSDRANKPFVPFNCAAVPRDLLETQLFGHRRGAFTGADRDHLGLIRSAAGGTLFLDEVADLALELQPKLLRFLESGEIAPLGETATLKANVRILAATHANLETAVTEGRFREDLFYRLNVVRLAIKPLRERRDEIPGMVTRFIAAAAHEFKKGHVEIAEEAMERLLLYRWPGNVRQLQNEIRRIVAIVDPFATIEPAAISSTIVDALPDLRAVPASTNGNEIAVPLTEKLVPTLSRIEYEMVKAALRDSHGRLDAAAKALGISRKGLYLKRQRLGL